MPGPLSFLHILGMMPNRRARTILTWLILTASLNRTPATLERLVLSEPAKSTRCSLEASMSTSPECGQGGSCCCNVSTRTEWERLDASFMAVAPVDLQGKWEGEAGTEWERMEGGGTSGPTGEVGGRGRHRVGADGGRWHQWTYRGWTGKQSQGDQGADAFCHASVLARG